MRYWKWMSAGVLVMVAVVAWAGGLNINPNNYPKGGTDQSGDITTTGTPGPGDPVAWAGDGEPMIHLLLRNGHQVDLTKTIDDEGLVCYVRAGSSTAGPPPIYIPSLTAYFTDQGDFSLWVAGVTNVTPGATYTQD